MASNSYHIIHVDFILFRFHIIILFVLLPCVMSFTSFNSYLLHVRHVRSYSKQTYTYTMANRNISSHIKYIHGQIRLIQIHIRLMSLSWLKPLIESLQQLHFMFRGCPFNSSFYRFIKFSFSKVSRPESLTRPGCRIQAGAWFTLTFSIKTFFLVLLNFYFQKCRDPNPRLDPVGGSKLEPGLLLHFQLSSQNMLFVLFHFRLFNYSKTLLFGQSHNHLQIQKTHNIHI